MCASTVRYIFVAKNKNVFVKLRPCSLFKSILEHLLFLALSWKTQIYTLIPAVSYEHCLQQQKVQVSFELVGLTVFLLLKASSLVS